MRLSSFLAFTTILIVFLILFALTFAVTVQALKKLPVYGFEDLLVGTLALVFIMLILAFAASMLVLVLEEEVWEVGRKR